jgi:hypothetical protein
MTRPIDIIRIDMHESTPDNERIRINDRRLNDILHDLSHKSENKAIFSWAKDKRYFIDAPELLRTVSEDGGFRFIVCGCGVPGCLGDSPIIVSREGEFIRWKVSSPGCTSTLLTK